MPSKSSAINSNQRKLLESVLQKAWDEGCPVAGGDPATRKAMAAHVLRHVMSSSRRSIGDTPDQRANALAKGLVAKFEDEPKLVGPLIADYRWLARRLVEALDTAAEEE